MDKCKDKNVQKAGKIFCLLALLLAAPAGAVDLLNIYYLAVENDPTIRGVGFQHSAAAESVKEARASLLPQVGLEYQRIETTQDIKSADNAVFGQGSTSFPTTDYSLTLTQPLFNWASYQGYKQAKADKLRADAEFLSAQQDLMLRTADIYMAALAADDELDFADAEKVAVERQLELAQNKMRQGLVRKTDLYDAQARYASVEADVFQAQSSQDDSLQALREVAGEFPGELAILSPEIDLVHPEPRDPESWMQAAMEQNPRVQLQHHAVAVSRHEVNMQKAGHYPTVDFSYRINNRDTEGTLFGGGSEVETDDMMIRLNVPIYSGGRVSARKHKSYNLYQKSMEDLVQVQRAVQREARASYYGVISSISKVEALSKSVESQELALKSKQGGYRSGLYASLEVLDAERDLYLAKRDYAQARYDYLINSLRLKHAVGTLNEADIEGINAWLH